MFLFVIGQNNDERQTFGRTISQIAITEVFKGGSMGKGTMIPGDFDVDLIIFSRCKFYYLMCLCVYMCARVHACVCVSMHACCLMSATLQALK